jgi:hypothetical protein
LSMTAGSAAGRGVTIFPPGGPNSGIGVMSAEARGEESNAGTGTPRAGGGTAPGGRSVAVAVTTFRSSPNVGIGERLRVGGGGGAPEGRLAGDAAIPAGLRLGPSLPKLLGAKVSRAGPCAGCGAGCEADALRARLCFAGVAGRDARCVGEVGRRAVSGSRACSRFASGIDDASSGTRLAGNHSLQPLRQINVLASNAPPLSAARKVCSVPDCRVPSAASQKN